MQHLQEQLFVRLRDILVTDIRITLDSYNLVTGRDLRVQEMEFSPDGLTELAEEYMAWFGEETAWHTTFNAMWQILKIAGCEYDNLKEVLDFERSQ